MTRTYDEAVAEFWSRVDKSGDCWIWQGKRFPNGYGTVCITPLRGSAHRIAYTIAVGPIPTGLLVCHHCDCKPCVRPDHLFTGTTFDNTADMIAKGRAPQFPRSWHVHTGEDNGRAKVTWEQVQEIRQLFTSQSISKSELARMFSISRAQVRNILDGISWAPNR